MFEIIIIVVIIFLVIRKKNEAGRENIGSARDTIQTTTAPAHRMQRPGHTPAPPASHNTIPSSGSTTAYLNEKARRDAIEHAREDREEEMRLNKAYGGLRAAERLYEGDSVPQGKRLCVCGYCGAENLLPVTSRERFSCYFCREPLT